MTGGNVLEGDLLPEVCNSLAIGIWRPIDLCSMILLTSGTLGVVLDVLSLLDELVLGSRAGHASLSRSAQLRSEARGRSGKLSGGGHRGRWLFGDEVEVCKQVCEIRSF